MKNLLSFFVLCVILLGGAALTQAQSGEPNGNFMQLAAGRWTGTLEYSDYQSGALVKLKTDLTVTAAPDGNSAVFSYVYDDFGKVMKSADTHRIERAAKKYFIGKSEFSFAETNNQIILSGEQIDGEKLEKVRTTITAEPDALTILKETRTPFAFRHRYVFKRATAAPEPEKTLTAAQMREDFAVFRRALLQLHPGIYRYNTPAELEKIFRDAELKLQDARPESEFFKLLAEIASRLACGHTYLNPLNQTKAVRARLFGQKNHLPFYFRLIDERMIVTGNVSSKKLPPGSEITKINNIPIEKIIGELLSITTADGRNTTKGRLKSLELKRGRENSFQTFDIYFPLFFPPKDEIFTIEAVDFQTKKTSVFQVPAMTRSERLSESEKVYGAAPTYDDEWKFETRGDSTAVLKIGHSLTWRLKKTDYKKFIADAFAEMRAQKIKHLIIDWRGNDGGSSEVGDELLKKLAKKKIDCAYPTKRFVRVYRPDKDLSAFIEVFDDRMRRFLTDGVPADTVTKSGDLYEVNDSAACRPVIPTENFFAGRAFLIAGAENASAAFEFVRAVKANRLAEIVGTETSGNLQGINGGNYFLLRLPQSMFEIDIPVYFQAPAVPQKDAGVAPDHLIKPNVADIAAGRDAELNYIWARIKAGK